MTEQKRPYKRKSSKNPNDYMEGYIPPQNTDIEKAVLGAILMASNDLDKIISEINPQLFFDHKNSLICTAILQLYKQSTGIDILTVTQQLRSNNDLENAGGVLYISDLTTRIASISHIEYHFRILQEQALRRNLIRITSESMISSYDSDNDVFDVFAQTQHKLDDAIREVVTYEVEAVGSIHEKKLNNAIHNLKEGIKDGVPTGLTYLDNTTNGWQKTDFIIIAGRPGMGKTAFVVSSTIYPTISKNIPVAIFSLEMSKEQLTSRIESYLSGVNVSTIVKGMCSEEELLMIQNKGKALTNAPLYIDDTPGISLLELKGKARKLKKENGIQLLIIDYLQLMTSGVRTNSREQEIAEISRGLKNLAKELQIPVIALSQLSRSVEQRGGDKKPMLSDLRESGQIEQDADLVGFCYRPNYYGLTEDYQIGNNYYDSTELFVFIIAKHRNGELGEMPLRFIGENTKITNFNSNTNYSPSFVESSNINCTFEQNNDSEVDFNKPQGMVPNNSFDKPNISQRNDTFENGLNDPPF